jgi:hypothetical protein
MLECYESPTAIPYLVSGTYYTRTSNGVKSEGVELSNIVLYETRERVENGFIGIIRKVQISTSILDTKPQRKGELVIDGETYSFEDPVLRKNPLYVDFWESEVKALKK